MGLASRDCRLWLLPQKYSSAQGGVEKWGGWLQVLLLGGT